LDAFSQPSNVQLFPPPWLAQYVNDGTPLRSPPEIADFVHPGSWHRAPPPWRLQYRLGPETLKLGQPSVSHILPLFKIGFTNKVDIWKVLVETEGISSLIPVLGFSCEGCMLNVGLLPGAVV